MVLDGVVWNVLQSLRSNGALTFCWCIAILLKVNNIFVNVQTHGYPLSLTVLVTLSPEFLGGKNTRSHVKGQQPIQ